MRNNTVDIITSLCKIQWFCITKRLKNNQDIDKTLLHFRVTPSSSNAPSPGELLFGRTLSTTLPSRQETNVTTAEQRNALSRDQDTMKFYHDKHLLPTDLPKLYPGQPVRILDHATKTWTPGKILKQDNNSPISYLVITAGGSTLRQNRSQLREMSLLKYSDVVKSYPRRSTENISVKKRLTFDLPNQRDEIPKHSINQPPTDNVS